MHNEQTLTPYLHKPFYGTAAQVSLHALTVRDVCIRMCENKLKSVQSNRLIYSQQFFFFFNLTLPQLIKLPHHKTYRCNFYEACRGTNHVHKFYTYALHPFKSPHVSDN